MKIVQKHSIWVGVNFRENNLSRQSVAGERILKGLKHGSKIAIFDLQLQAIRCRGRLLGIGHIVDVIEKEGPRMRRPQLPLQELLQRTWELLRRNHIRFQRLGTYSGPIDVVA